MGPDWVDLAITFGILASAVAAGMFVGLFVPLALVLRRRFPKPPAAGERNPLELVRERYARGEISRDEYEQLREDLSETARS